MIIGEVNFSTVFSHYFANIQADIGAIGKLTVEEWTTPYWPFV